MITESEGSQAFRERLYESYSSTHAGLTSSVASAIIYRRDIRPHLPTLALGQRVLDIGCGQGELVALLTADGFLASGIDVSPEQVRLAHAAGRVHVRQGDFHDYLSASRGEWDAIVATDVLEHMNRQELLPTFDAIRAALKPNGLFLARVPNAVSPTGGHIMYGDITHQTWFTRHSVAQLAAVAGFAHVQTYACPPPVHGLRSSCRAAIWALISGLLKLALVAETGQLRGHIVTQNLTFVAHTAPRSDHTSIPAQ